jgi:hypothetical protein
MVREREDALLTMRIIFSPFLATWIASLRSQ